MTGKLIWKNLWFKKGNLLLSILLFTLGTAVISLLLLVQNGIDKKIDRDLKDIDAVVGAKGSPLQLVLSAVYHADAPTGNINYGELLAATRGPLVEQVIPLAYGDYYEGYRIVGTSIDYIDKYGGKLAFGSLFAEPMEAVAGAVVARQVGLKVNEHFQGNHGSEGEDHDTEYVLTGILQPTGTVLDYLILTPIESVWQVHSHNEVEQKESGQMPEEAKQPNERSNEPGNRSDETESGHKDNHKDKQDITAALVKFRSPMAIMTFPRMINSQTNFQAVNPTLEIKKLQQVVALGSDTIKAIAGIIMLVSAISVFIMLYTRLKERKFELALMRTMGGSRSLLAGLLLAEGIILSLAGALLGLLLSRIVLVFIKQANQLNSQIPFTFVPLPQEWLLLGISVILGIAAAIIPALSAWRLQIAKTLSNA